MLVKLKYSKPYPNEWIEYGNTKRNDMDLITLPFSGNYLTAIILPDALTEIEENALGEDEDLSFKYLAYVHIPGTVTTIKSYAFQKTKALAHLYIPPSVSDIGMFAFAGSGLTHLEIPNSVRIQGNGICAACKKLMYIILI